MSHRLGFFLIQSLFIAGICFAAGSAYAQSAFNDPGARTAGGGSNSGDLVPVSGNIQGGNVTIGASAQVVVLFRNDSAKPITSGAINLYPSSTISATVGLNQCAQEPLPPGAVCAIALSLKGLQAGNYRIEMLMRHDGRTRLVTSTISGSVESTGDATDQLISDVEAIPAEIDFGSLTASRTQVRSIVLRNITSNPINISDIYMEASPQSGYTIKQSCQSLEAGEACIVSLTWSPEQNGPSTGILVIEHDGPTRIASVTVEGEYAPETATAAQVFPEAVPGKGLLTSSLTEVDFGGGIENSSAITLSLVNIGDAPVQLDDIRLSNSENGVEIANSGCRIGTLLEPIQACPLTLTWAPTREGEIFDDLQIYHDGARGILVLPVRGSASQAVNKDTKAIVLNRGRANIMSSVSGVIPPVSERDLSDGESRASSAAPDPVPLPEVVDLSGVLEGFIVTSHAPNRAIIAGPGGSRVVFDGEETVIGGVLWTVKIRPSAVQFENGDQQVLLLFDRSLSSVNRVARQSSGGSSTSSADDGN